MTQPKKPFECNLSSRGIAFKADFDPQSCALLQNHCDHVINLTAADYNTVRVEIRRMQTAKVVCSFRRVRLCFPLNRARSSPTQQPQA